MKRINEDEIMGAIRDLQDEAYERLGRGVEVYVNTMNIGGAISAKVSWASIGTQTPEDAVTFASKILEAAEMARAFPYNGAVLMPAVIDDEGYEDYWYEMEDEQEETSEDEEQETEELRAYNHGDLEAFLNWEEDEYDLDGIMAEVTSIDPVTGDRYWDPEFADDETKLFDVCMRYHKDDDDGMPVIPDDGPRDFWDMIMERERADMEAFEQMKRERELRGYETGMTAEDIAVRWPE